jgi:hypothetical protein
MKQFKLHLAFAILALLAMPLACSQDDERAISDSAPVLSPTTKAIERAQQRFDPIAQQGEQVARTVQQTAATASAVGVPGAETVAIIAAAAGALLGAYNERRRGTNPLKTAITQIVQSVESAFPSKTPEQKAAMASVQDRTTKQLVSGIKGS